MTDDPTSGPGLVAVFRTSSPVQLAVVKSLLESSGIPCVVQGEEGLHLIPLGLSGGLLNPESLGAVIRVRPEDVEAVRQILQEIEPEIEEEFEQ